MKEAVEVAIRSIVVVCSRLEDCCTNWLNKLKPQNAAAVIKNSTRAKALGISLCA
jgi:hypothetical protein